VLLGGGGGLARNVSLRIPRSLDVLACVAARDVTLLGITDCVWRHGFLVSLRMIRMVGWEGHGSGRSVTLSCSQTVNNGSLAFLLGFEPHFLPMQRIFFVTTKPVRYPVQEIKFLCNFLSSSNRCTASHSSKFRSWHMESGAYIRFLQKLTVAHLMWKFLAVLWNPRLITVFTVVRL
jgi:hypothetical protein